MPHFHTFVAQPRIWMTLPMRSTAGLQSKAWLAEALSGADHTAAGALPQAKQQHVVPRPSSVLQIWTGHGAPSPPGSQRHCPCEGLVMPHLFFAGCHALTPISCRCVTESSAFGSWAAVIHSELQAETSIVPQQLCRLFPGSQPERLVLNSLSASH